MVNVQRRTATIQLRLTEDEKRLAELAAAQEDRSLTNYVLRLIKADAAKRGIKLAAAPKPPK